MNFLKVGYIMAKNKSEITQSEIERRILSGQRLRQYRKYRKMNTDDFARMILVSESALKKYEANSNPEHKGKYSPLRKDDASTLELISGIIADYWLGLTYETTYEGRMAELENEKASDEAQEQLHRLRAEELERRRNFFYACGYRYESIEGTASDDFCGITEDTQGLTPRPHILTNYADNTRHELTQEQFKDLFEKLQDTINFACFQADKANQ